MALLLKQLFAVIDNRTTVICLHAAGDITPVDEPFETLGGTYFEPPFHIHCRTLVGPYVKGMSMRIREEANAELQNRPEKQRRLGPAGEVGSRIPPPSNTNAPIGPAFSLADDPQDWRPMALRDSLTLGDDRIKMLERLGERYTRDDRVLSWILTEQGFDGLPVKVTAEEYEALVADHIRVFRGLTDEKFMADLVDGDFFAGKGMFGNGAYFTVDRSTAQAYAGDPSRVVEMMLRPTARVIDYEDVVTLMEAEMEAALDAGDLARVKVLGDTGRWAAANGWDSIRVRGAGEAGEDYYVVLNRTMLVVKE